MSLNTPLAGHPLRRSLLLLAVGLVLLIGGCGGGGGGGGGTANPPPPDTGGDSGGDTGDDGDAGTPPDYDGDDGDGGDTGDGGDGGDGGADDGAIEPTLASIQENVFTPICTQCHTGASAPQGLRLDEGVAYGMLVNVASTEVPELLRVDPGNPDDSYLIHKLEGTQSVGERMPLGGPYLSADTIGAIRQWIADGAPETATAPQGKPVLTGAWPVPDTTLTEAPGQILLISDRELDVSLLRAGLVQVVNLDNIDPMTQRPQPVENLRMQITSLDPTVIRLDAPAAAWSEGRYEVRVDGSGALAMADRSGKVIDGNADGKPGGDFVMHFEIENLAGERGR